MQEAGTGALLGSNQPDHIPLGGAVAQLDGQGIEQVLVHIQVLTDVRDGVLLCYEQISDTKWCHRTMLSAWLNEHGQESAEL